ncbi:nucleotidyltransferase family protein, partial [Weissella soli]
AAAFASPAVVQEWDEWLPLLRYRVQMSPVSALEKIYQLNDGLAFRLHTVMDRLPKNASMTELMARYKSKRYTQARLQRSLLYTLLNITDDEMQLAMQQPYLRVLGTTGRGRQFIKDHRQQVALPVVNRTDEQAIAGLQKLDYRAGRLYELMTNPSTNGMHQDTGRIPIILE